VFEAESSNGRIRIVLGLGVKNDGFPSGFTHKETRVQARRDFGFHHAARGCDSADPHRWKTLWPFRRAECRFRRGHGSRSAGGCETGECLDEFSAWLHESE
jgi:hypothetical protein